jgi:hypothetical protein
MIQIPNGRLWFQHNRSDVLGSLWSSFNIDITSAYTNTQVSPRTIITTDNPTDFGTPCVFKIFTDQNGSKQYAWTVAGKFVWRMDVSSGYQTAFTKVTTTNAPDGTTNDKSCSSDYSDMVIYGTRYLIVSGYDKIFYFDANDGTWGSFALGSISGGVNHKMCVFGTRVYITDPVPSTFTVKVMSFDISTIGSSIVTSGTYTLNLSAGFPITSITTLNAVSNGIWIGTSNQGVEGCSMFFWDGVLANTPQSQYLIKDANAILACEIINNTPYIIDNNGRLLVFNGQSFVEVPNGRLPVKPSKLLKNPLSNENNRWIHPNGISIVNGRINILVNNEYNDYGKTIEEKLPSGIWEFDKDMGWYHKSVLSIYTNSIKDAGQNRLSRVGALFVDKDPSTGSTSNGNMLIGADYFSDATTIKSAVWTNDRNDTILKSGYFVTTKIYATHPQDSWNKLYIRLKKLQSADDKVIVKFRTDDIPSTETTITWTNTTTFTTTDDVSNYVIGDEVEGIQGTGSGFLGHITSISALSGTWTVILDTTFTGATGTAKVRFQKWKKINTFNSQLSNIFDTTIGQPSGWIQFKVQLIFSGSDAIDDLLLENIPFQKAQSYGQYN